MILTPKLNNVFSILLLFSVSHYVSADPLQSEVIQESLVSYIESTANELIRLGVDKNAIQITAVSDSQPMFYESMPEGEAGNRRAEIFYTF